MLTKTLLGFSIMCNFATLLGLWLTYESSPVPVQAKFGRILLLCGAVTSIIGYVIFAIFVVKAQSTATRQKDTKEVPPPENVSRPRLDALARKLGIYIGSAGVAAQVIGDTLTVRLTVFTCTNIELRFIRAVLNTGIGEVVLESSEPHRIVPFMELEKTFTKTLTPDEARRAPNWASTITISGKAKFEDHIEKDFSFGSALSQPALSRPT